MEYKDIKNFTGINRGVSPFLAIEGELSDSQNIKTEKIGIIQKTGDYTIKNTQILDNQEIYSGADYVTADGYHVHLIGINGSSYAKIYYESNGMLSSPSSSISSSQSPSSSISSSASSSLSASISSSSSGSASPSAGMIELIDSDFFSDANLQAYWRFENNSNDSKSTNHGADTAISYSTGKFGQAAGFASSSPSRIVIPDASSLKPSGNFTVSFWMNDSTIGTNATLFGSYTQISAVSGFVIHKISTNKIRFISGKNSGLVQGIDFQQHDSTITVTDGDWHHIACVYDGSKLRIYIDGAEEGSGTSWSNAAQYIASNKVTVGAYYDGSYQYPYNGKIDDLALFNRALSSSEISLIYNP